MKRGVGNRPAALLVFPFSLHVFPAARFYFFSGYERVTNK